MSWRRDRAHYWELRAKNLCVLCACPLRAGDPGVYCQKCADKKNARRNEQRRQWLAAGLCRTCGRPVEKSHTRCPRCLADKRHKTKGAEAVRKK